MSKHSNERAIRILEEKIDYTFSNKNLLITALTHSSYINEAEMVIENQAEDYYLGHNERFEFLGDAVLEIAITEELFLRFPHEREGALTNKRTSLVRNKRLVDIAKKLDLQALLRIGIGEIAQGGREREAILSDAFEALLGAMYIDAKIAKLADPHEPIRNLIKKLYVDLWLEAPAIKATKDNKSLLQERTQILFKTTPKYIVKSITGEGHKQTFNIELHLPNEQVIKEKGSSKKMAEQKAAERALKMLENYKPANL